MPNLKRRSKQKMWDIDLACPESWLSKLTLNPCRNFGFLCVFLTIGILLHKKYPFPCFYPFVCMFLFIGILCLLGERHYCKRIREIRSALRPQKCALEANDFMTIYGTRSIGFLIAPIATVLIFGTGGCTMFGALELTPTLIWVLLLFVIVVAISIVGYLQYIYLAIYIAKLSYSEGHYTGLEKKAANYIPAEISWIKNLTKLSHVYRTIFFTLGSTYIAAFSGFCFWPDMKAQTSSPCFYILWGIIFVAIVLTFPIVSTLEHRWIKRIIQRLKESYIHDLEQEQNVLRKSSSGQLASAVISINVRQIIDSKDYPLRSTWGSGYAVVLALVNFITATTTIFTDTLPLINGLWQLFL